MAIDGAERPVPDARVGFDVVVRRYRAACLALAQRVLRDHHLAEDAVQEAFLDAWRLAATYDAARASQQGWLLTLTHRRAVDRVRREERQAVARLSLEALTGSGETVAPPEDEVWRTERATSLRRALLQLSDDQYEVLVLAYFGGYTQREIAGLVGIPLGTVKTRTLTALRRLAVLLRTSREVG